MKYKVYIEGGYLVFKPRFHQETRIPFKDISEFVIEKSWAFKRSLVVINGISLFYQKELPEIAGTIVIGMERGLEKTIQKRCYRKVITTYPWVKIKDIDDVFRIAQQLLDLGIHYEQNLVYKTVEKFDNDDNCFYRNERFFYHGH